MSDKLLPYYHRELAFIRRLGAEFASEHPDVAAGLQIGADTCEDPHVERMIMAFAYLAARIRCKLDDDFPEITNALLGVLYPHYQAPIPSTSIVEFQLDRGQATLAEGYRIDRGRAVETQPIGGEPCKFRTCYPVTLWPFEVAGASLGGLPFQTPVIPDEAVGLLRLKLRCFAKDMTFAKLKLPSLRFYLNGQPHHVFALYELIFNNTLLVTLASSADDPDPIVLERDCLVPVGFERDEALVPYSARSFAGYRLLSEYFAFPQKFCFFELSGLSPELLGGLGSEVEVCFYVNETPSDLEQNVSADTFRLGCTPMVNLYEQRSEPIRLNHLDNEYRVCPDARRPKATEIYSVNRVTATSPKGDSVEYQPFYSFKHAVSRDDQTTFWYATRRPSRQEEHHVDHGTEIFLSLVDLGFTTSVPATWTLDVETTCLNRDLPKRLPFGGGQPLLHLPDGGPISRLTCLTPPTATYRPELGSGAMWKVISHLSLNHLSITDLQRSPDALREILKLYDYSEQPDTRSKIAGILSVGSRRVVGRVRSANSLSGFCRGVQIDMEFDQERYSDNGLFLFATVLERFLGLYCSVNSFTKLSIRTKQRKGTLREWPPRAGEKVLL